MLNSKKPFSPRLVCDERNGRYFLPNFGQCDRVNLLIGKASVSWIKLPGNEEERRRRRRGIKCCNSTATRWLNCPSIYSSNLIRWQSTSTRSLNAQCTKYDILWSIFPCCRQPRSPFSSVKQNMEKVQDCCFPNKIR